jgi:hypothetical protein
MVIIIISTNLHTPQMIAKKVLQFVRTYLHLVKANIL